MVVSDPLRPTSTVQFTWGVGTGHVDIDDEITQPDEPNPDTDLINALQSSGDDGEVVIFGFPTLSGVGEVTNVTVWSCGWTGIDNPPQQGDVSIDMSGIGEEEDYQNLDLQSVGLGMEWTSNSFDGSWSQSDLDSLEVYYRADCDIKNAQNAVFVMYCIITYTEGAYSAGDPLGVPIANVASVMGVAIGDIASIKGV